MTDALRLLIVDDDLVDRRAVKRLLATAGVVAEIVECSDRDSALAAVQRERFDCVLLDYRLPGTDGVTLLRDLRDRSMDLAVVALTGQGDQELAVELMKAGASDYLDKNNLTPERLERSLRYALSMSRAELQRRELLEREQRARLEAQAANRAKDEFLATLSHELRTPLNAILGWTQLLAGGQLDAAAGRRAIEIIERNTRLQAQLIDDLLDISRIITNQLRLELRPVAVDAILQAAIDTAVPAAAAKDIAIVRETADLGTSVSCDQARMQQVIWNLLSNAIKFTPEHGTVRLSEGRDNGHVVLTVSDTGIGIEPEFLPHVFDRFRQQDPATTRRHGGLGLGLSIVRHIVDMHGGTIEVASEGAGRGAAFTVKIPVAAVAAEAARSADRDRDGAETSLEGIRVLVVDNEADARGLVSAILESRGAEVTAVESAAEALQTIEADRPDVLLSDIAMPGVDGYGLIREVRRRESAAAPLPAAALTAFAADSDRVKAIDAGYQAHLRKPVEPAELTAVVAALARGEAHHR
jgi:signal transduction histidine kinase